MIDNLSLAISHGLMLLAAWRLLSRADLNSNDAASRPGGFRGFRRRPPGPQDDRDAA